MSMPTPPETLHELLNLAIDTMWGLDREVYSPAANSWHTPSYIGDKMCHVCLAGVMMTLIHDPRTFISLDESYPNTAWKQKFLMLEMLRLGFVDAAAKQMNRDTPPDHITDRTIVNRHFVGWEQAKSFLGEMEMLRDELKKEGLCRDEKEDIHETTGLSSRADDPGHRHDAWVGPEDIQTRTLGGLAVA